MATLTREEVVDALGRTDDLVIAEIIATGATREELVEAQAWIANDDPLLASGRPRGPTGGDPRSGSGGGRSAVGAQRTLEAGASVPV
jgi:hypothetical protein